MRTRTILSAAILAGTLTGALRAQERRAGAVVEFICDGNYFSASVPADWEQAEEILLGRDEKQYGVDLRAPDSDGGAATTISLLYFGPDHLRFSNSEAYVSMILSPSPKPLEGEERKPPLSVTLDGRPAVIYDILRYLTVPPSARPGRVLMLDRYVVVPAEKGFYVLRLFSPNTAANGYVRVFERILASFQPTVR